MTRIPKKRLEIMGWEVTRRCNLTCPHCYSAATRKALNEIKTEEGYPIIDALKRLGTRGIGWTGGEPLLKPDLEEWIAAAKKQGIKSGITTNGVLLDEKRARSLMKAGAHSMQISIDGSTAAWNQRMRRATPEEYEKALEAVRICKRLGYNTSMAMLIGQENLDDAVPYIRLARKLKVDIVRFCGFVPHGRGKGESHRLGFDRRLPDLKKFVERYAGSAKPIIAFDPAFGPLPPDYRFHKCMAGMKMIYMSCTGDIYPCTSLLSKEFVVGNIRRRSLEEIWNDPKMTAMAFRSGRNIHGFCRGCEHRRICHAACRGVTYAHTGDLDGSLPVCLKQAQTRRRVSITR